MARLGHVGGQGLIGAGLVLLAVQHVVLLHDLVVESVHLPQLVHLLELAVQNVPAGNKLGTSNLRRKKRRKKKKKRAISEMPMALEVGGEMGRGEEAGRGRREAEQGECRNNVQH